MLTTVGIETVNLYAAFLALAVALTQPSGEIVAIVPRSFCNGAYFRPFRKWLLDRAALRHVHVFHSRNRAFVDDDVLQENIIVKLERSGTLGSVTISTSTDPSFRDYTEHRVEAEQVIRPQDHEAFIHLPTTSLKADSELFCQTLADLGLEVSTGPVVDFRVRDHWAVDSRVGVPLLYAHHFAGGRFSWPRPHKKPNALLVNAHTKKWLMPGGWYTLTKRFSAKEERRRLVAFVVDPTALPHKLYGFENHLNVFHSGKNGLEPDIARGLSVFLNSSAADLRFRIFSGHTQVNATDLRCMLFPRRQTLVKLGRWLGTHPHPTQQEIDAYVEPHTACDSP